MGRAREDYWAHTDEVGSCSNVEKKYSYIGSQLINTNFDMANECVNISYSSKCLEESLEFTAATTNDNEATILLNLPEGSKIVTPSGEVVYTVEGGPGKTSIRIPPLN